MKYNTGAKCVVCREEVVAEVEPVATTSIENIPIGPGSRNYYRAEVTSIHCSSENCALRYHLPPGKPNAVAEVLAMHRQSRSDDDL